MTDNSKSATFNYDFKSPSRDLEDLMAGMDIDCDLQVPEELPPWLDKEKYLRGRNVFESYRLGIVLSNYGSLIIGLCIPNLW